MKRSWRVPIIGAFIMLAVLLPAAITFYTDWLWFGETGYQDVFLTRLSAASSTQRSSDASSRAFGNSTRRSTPRSR